MLHVASRVISQSSYVLGHVNGEMPITIARGARALHGNFEENLGSPKRI